MDELTPLRQSPPDSREGQVPPALSPIDPRWALRTGLLHFVNEATLWPLGFALVVGSDANGAVGLALMESNGPLVPEIDLAEHAATHRAFLAMLAHRFAPVEGTAEERTAKEARARLVLPR